MTSLKKIIRNWPQKLLLSMTLVVTIAVVVLMSTDLSRPQSDVILKMQFSTQADQKIVLQSLPNVKIIYETPDTKIVRVVTRNSEQLLERLSKFNGVKYVEIR